LESNSWELYHVAKDFAECHNVADKHPAKLQELVQRWWTEAGKYKVLPIDGRAMQRLAEPRPQTGVPRNKFIYYPGGGPIAIYGAPILYNRSYSITAEVVIPPEGAEGILLAQGGRHGGHSFYVKGNKLYYVYNFLGKKKFRVTSNQDVPKGRVTLRFEFEKTGVPDIRKGKGAPGRGQLYINEKPVGNTDFPVTVPVTFGLEGALSCGYSSGDVVVPEDYSGDFTFTGKIERVIVDTSGELVVDTEAVVQRILARD
jgi:arylsulfatase